MMARARQALELSVPVWIAGGVVVVCLALMGVAGFAYVNSVAARQQRLLVEQQRIERENDRRWCALLDTLDLGYRAAPPATPTGRAIAQAITDLRHAFGCTDSPPIPVPASPTPS
jgi:hypothetical protein